MLIKTQGNGFNHPVSSEITERAHYEKRRDILKMMATGVAGGAMATWASRQALAQAAGGKMSDVVQLNVFATELAVDDFQRVRREFFSGDFPCSTFVQVKGLADPRLVVEINATGFIGAGN